MQPLFRFPSTPVFEHVRPYRRIRDEVRRYLRSNLLVVDDGLEERIKSTSRLYEQWVYFQLAAAFRRAGLRCQQDEGVLRRSHLFRFTLEMDRGARLLFLAEDGRAVGLRFKPWVSPLHAAGERGDDYCHGMHGEAAWSPDVLIEFLDGPGPAANVQYAVVVDAKYTSRIREHHWADTGKYLHIRATRTRRQVVKQLWLAWPDERETIVPRDVAVLWTRDGPDCPRDETVQGVLGAAAAAPARRHRRGGRVDQHAGADGNGVRHGAAEIPGRAASVGVAEVERPCPSFAGLVQKNNRLAPQELLLLSPTAGGRGRRRKDMPQVLVKDADLADELIQERKRTGANRYDEVWEGMYVMPSMPKNANTNSWSATWAKSFARWSRRQGLDKAIRVPTSATAERGGIQPSRPRPSRGPEKQPGDRLRHPLLRWSRLPR